MDRETWSKKLKAYVSATQASMKLAAELAEAALDHFAKHGDVIYLNEFLEAMHANYNRRAAFVKWAADHAPLGMVEGKFVKNKDKAEKSGWDNKDGEIKAKALKAASEKTFWEYVPAPRPVIVDENTVVQGLFAFINRNRNAETHKTTPRALALLSRIEGIALTLKQDVEASKREAAEEAEANQGENKAEDAA